MIADTNYQKYVIKEVVFSASSHIEVSSQKLDRSWTSNLRLLDGVPTINTMAVMANK